MVKGSAMSQIAALIVDDSWVMREIVERALRQAECVGEVLEASSGMEALELLGHTRVDLIRTDTTCPTWMGLSLFAR